MSDERRRRQHDNRSYRNCHVVVVVTSRARRGEARTSNARVTRGKAGRHVVLSSQFVVGKGEGKGGRERGGGDTTAMMRRSRQHGHDGRG